MKKKYMLILSIILLLACVVFVIIFKGKNTNPDEDIMVSKERTEEYVIDKYKDGLITYNGVDLICYDTDMTQEWVVNADRKDAVVTVNGKYILLHSKNSDNITIVKEGKTVTEFNTDKELRTATINENGYTMALTSDKGYKGQCFVYDENGRAKAEYSFGEKYILGAFLTSDNTTLIMNVIEDAEDKASGKILFADVKSGEIKNEIKSEGIYSYVNVYNDKVLVSTDEALVCYDKKGKEKWSYSYDGGEALWIGLSDKYITMVIKTKESFGGNEVVTLNSSGRVKGIYNSESQISAFDMSEGYSAILVNDEILMLNKKGKILSSIESDSNTRNIKLFANSERVIAISEKAVMKQFYR